MVGERLSEAVDEFARNLNNKIIAASEQMEKECKDPPCRHAQGLRLAVSYVEGERVC